MISRIRIQNFRRNRFLDLTLGSITVIRGRSAAGKSSLLGALRWVAFNQPAGARFIHWGRKQATVGLQVDGHQILRHRGPAANYYRLDRHLYRAFGTNVPAPIQNCLRLTPLNFHRQHAPHFWFSLTPGEVARQLNQIVNLELVDRILDNLNRKLRTNRILRNEAEQRVEQARERWQALQYVRPLDRDLARLEVREARIAEIAGNALQLAKMLEGAFQVGSRGKNRSYALQRALAAQSIGQQVAKIALRREKLAEWVQTARRYEARSARPLPDLEPVEMMARNWNRNREQRDRLQDMLTTVRRLHSHSRQAQRQIRSLQQQIKQQMGKRCPLCGSILSGGEK